MKKKNANGERLFLLLFLIFALVIAGGLGVWKLNSEESDDKLIDVRGGYLLYLIPSEDVCSYDEKKLIVENGVVNETILNVYLEGTQVDLAGQVC